MNISLYPFDGLFPLLVWYLLTTFDLNSVLSTNSSLFQLSWYIISLSFCVCLWQWGIFAAVVSWVSVSLHLVIGPFVFTEMYTSVCLLSPSSYIEKYRCWKNLPPINWLRASRNYTRVWLTRTSPGNSELGLLANGKKKKSKKQKACFSPLEIRVLNIGYITKQHRKFLSEQLVLQINWNSFKDGAQRWSDSNTPLEHHCFYLGNWI